MTKLGLSACTALVFAGISIAAAPPAHAFATTALGSFGPLEDGFAVFSGGELDLFHSATELPTGIELSIHFGLVSAPPGFIPGVVLLLEPPGQANEAPLFGSTMLSDVFAMQFEETHPSELDAGMISDGASIAFQSGFLSVFASAFASGNMATLVETGAAQDVSFVFGQPPDFAAVESDVSEPATPAVLGVGFAGLGIVRRRRKAR
jgi:hypothetical protein